jgi:hypothetical protein
MGGSNNEFAKFGRETGQVLLDVVTLGQNFNARNMKKQQDRAIGESRRLQAEQDAEMERIGPAPTLSMPSEEQQDARRRRRLMALQAGLSSTVKAKPQVGSEIYRPSATGRTTLGE